MQIGTDSDGKGSIEHPCGHDCPDLKEARCKPSGDLRFMLADFPQLGAIARLHTTSYRSLRQIHSALQQVQTITGGRLAGIRAALVVQAEKTLYLGNDHARHSTVVPILSLQIKAEGMKTLIGKMVETAQLFQETRKALGGHVQVIEADDETLAAEIQPEFFPETGEKPEKRQARQERERGTLEPGKQPNRGHGAEGFDKQQPRLAPRATPPPPPTEPPDPEPESHIEESQFDDAAPPDDANDMERMCERCEVPHPRSQHDGELGDGPCLECECTGFSATPPAPCFDTVMADVSGKPSADKPKWAELPRVVGKVVAFQNTDRDGMLLKSSRGATFVIVNLFGISDAPDANPTAAFFCFHQTLQDPLELSLGEKVALVYAVQPPKPGDTRVFQMIHDIQQIGAKRFDEKKEGCAGCGLRGTIKIGDPLNQEPLFKAEDENQAAR